MTEIYVNNYSREDGTPVNGYTRSANSPIALQLAEQRAQVQQQISGEPLPIFDRYQGRLEKRERRLQQYQAWRAMPAKDKILAIYDKFRSK